MKEDDLIIAARQIEADANSLAKHYAKLEEALKAFRRQAYRDGGVYGAEDVNNGGADCSRAAREVVGVLYGAGLGPLFENAGIPVGSVEPVTRYTDRWQKRLQHGNLVTRRGGGPSPLVR